MCSPQTSSLCLIRSKLLKYLLIPQAFRNKGPPSFFKGRFLTKRTIQRKDTGWYYSAYFKSPSYCFRMTSYNVEHCVYFNLVAASQRQTASEFLLNQRPYSALWARRDSKPLKWPQQSCVLCRAATKSLTSYKFLFALVPGSLFMVFGSFLQSLC